MKISNTNVGIFSKYEKADVVYCELEECIRSGVYRGYFVASEDLGIRKDILRTFRSAIWAYAVIILVLDIFGFSGKWISVLLLLVANVALIVAYSKYAIVIAMKAFFLEQGSKSDVERYIGIRRLLLLSIIEEDLSQVILISKECAEKGLERALDLLKQDHEAQLLLNFRLKAYLEQNDALGKYVEAKNKKYLKIIKDLKEEFPTS